MRSILGGVRLKPAIFLLSLVVPALGAASSVAAQNSDPIPAPSAAAVFDIATFQVKGNAIIPKSEVEDLVYPFLGPGKTAADVEAARAALQAAFEKRGYAAISVLIPEQSVDGGVIRLEVAPQTIGKITVAGGSRTSRSWVLDRAPSLKQGAVPNFAELQRDIVGLNRSADRTITPDIKAGIAPGTIDVDLRIEDKSPFHGSAELNNFASAQTSALRVAGSLRYDDLWGRGDSVSISTQFAPERSGDGAVISANYLTRIGNVQLLAYGVHSESDIAIIGGINIIGNGDIAGGRLIIPLAQRDGFYSAVTLGLDYKHFGESLLLGADSDSAPITYVPASASWRGDWTTGSTRQSVTISGTLGVRGLGDGRVAFDRKRFEAEPNFFYVRADATHQQDLVGKLQAYFHVSGQWAGEPLISNEQFSIGGMETVRGYFESEVLSDYGTAIQAELRSPPLGSLVGIPDDDLRVHLFFDSGTGALRNPLPAQRKYQSLASTGVGAQVKVFNLFNGSVDLGVPLVDGPNSETGSIFARFRIWGEF